MSWVAGADRYYAELTPVRELKISPCLKLHALEEPVQVDFVTDEVLSHRLWHICDEAGVTIRHVSGSPVATEANDFMTVIADENGDVVFMTPYLLYQATVFEPMIKWTLQNRSESPGIDDGDMFLCNDPWVGAVHQNDVALFAPVFHDGQLFCWVGASIHEVDVGGSAPGSFSIDAKDVFGEVPPLPPVKIVRRFQLQADIEDLYTRRSRQPRLLSLDLRAQIAANNVARARILESIERYGADTVKAVMRNVMDRAESQLRARLSEIPDGTWRHVDFQEVSGAGDRGVYAAHLEMTKTGDHLHFDFTGTAAQAGIINSATAGARAGVFAALLPVLVGEIPWAPGGLQRCLSLTNPRGTILNAEYPAAVSMGSITGTWLAHNCAPRHNLENAAHPPGTSPPRAVGRRRLLARHATLRLGQDRLRLRHPVSGSQSDGLRRPVLRRRRRHRRRLLHPLRPHPERGGDRIHMALAGALSRRGGRQRRRGAMARRTRRQFRFHAAQDGPALRPCLGRVPCRDSQRRRAQRRHARRLGRLHDAAGLQHQGRHRGRRLAAGIGRADRQLEVLPPKSQTTQNVEDIYSITFFGGGGYGDPLDRALDDVEQDLASGAVTPAEAKRLYGVAIADGRLDAEASARPSGGD